MLAVGGGTSVVLATAISVGKVIACEARMGRELYMLHVGPANIGMPCALATGGRVVFATNI